ncbi:hypothetical protein MIND_00727500 [Mycena indigotica]|uniref:Uncharacterized protein n=1 Tax=Mycena indigotica TaxID=2126181 RepID=A0A8H6SMK7_9AGAR|nr:uncharacterized protein MIND_00727500 [Mycena indigotica]KAF7301620.1 hypothetical protein MIND_00727500 [Mycena indigotica]
MLVAHRVKEWIEPLLYRTLAFNPDTVIRGMVACWDVDRFLQTAAHKPPEFFAKAVRNVLFSRIDESKIIEVLTLCPNIEKLSLLLVGEFGEPLDSLAAVFNPLSPSQIFCATQDLVQMTRDFEYCVPAFAFLTHLEVLGGYEQDDDEGPEEAQEFLMTLPQLTHLCFSGGMILHEDICRNLLEALPIRIQTFVWSAQESHDLPAELLDDVRFVVIYPPDSTDADWQRGCLNGRNFWTAADEWVALRRAGTVQHCFSYLQNGEEREGEEEDDDE